MNLITNHACHSCLSKSRPFSLLDRCILDPQIFRYHRQEQHQQGDEEGGGEDERTRARITVIQVIEYTLLYVLNELNEDDVSHKQVIVEDTVHNTPPPSFFVHDEDTDSRRGCAEDAPGDKDEAYTLNNTFPLGTTTNTTEHRNGKIDRDASSQP